MMTFYCPRCGCPLDPWPLLRHDNCGPEPHTGERRVCYRWPHDVMKSPVRKKPHPNYLKAVADGYAFDIAKHQEKDHAEVSGL